jgi:hypothetical protein
MSQARLCEFLSTPRSSSPHHCSWTGKSRLQVLYIIGVVVIPPFSNMTISVPVSSVDLSNLVNLFDFLGSNFFIPLYKRFFSCYEALSVCMYAKGFSHPVESLSFCFVRIFVRNRW